MSLSMRWEGVNDETETAEIVVRDVYAYRVTYPPALTLNLIKSAYDQLIELDESEWARTVEPTAANPLASPLREFRVRFDDGPCYDVLCTGLEVRLSSPYGSQILAP